MGIRRYGAVLVVSASVFLVTTGAAGERKWQAFDDCKLLTNQANDGDSFHVKCNNREYIFRICFVDAPETSMTIPARVREQGEHWGISDEAVLDWGARAGEFTRDLLSNNEFMVFTKFEDARGRSKLPRHFAMIRVKDRFLSELLVENGLGRAYGYMVDLPDGSDDRRYMKGLDRLEAKAKRKKVGIWRGEPKVSERVLSRKDRAQAKQEE